jgi:hypothetical protein
MLTYADVCAQVASRLRAQHPSASIAVLTFYKGQLQELMRCTPAALQVTLTYADIC